MAAQEHHLSVERTARYYTLGDPSSARDVWFVLHGYGQLAAYFIRHFAAIDDGTRLIVAPEALSRFYLEQTTWKGTGQARVGATWMTRDDRLAEIADYVKYLDRQYQQVFAAIDRDITRVTVLGFSQGVATACRWLAAGKARADQLVLWAGPVPPELSAADLATLRATKFVRVIGDRDDMAAPELLAAEEARVRALGIDAPLQRFVGGHELNAVMLRSLAD